MLTPSEPQERGSDARRIKEALVAMGAEGLCAALGLCDGPRAAFVKAGRIRRLEFNPSLQCDTLAVISWAEWAAKGGR